MVSDLIAVYIGAQLIICVISFLVWVSDGVEFKEALGVMLFWPILLPAMGLIGSFSLLMKMVK